MQKISFEDTTVVKSPYVIIDGVEHEVYNGTYQGGTDLNAQTFNQMQDNIESAIDSLNVYSTNETVIGEWDEKTLYRQIINFGSLPNNTSKKVTYDLTNKIIQNIYGRAIYNKSTLPLPYINLDLNYSIVIDINTDGIRIVTGTDRSSYSGYIVLEYTKTTD